MCLFQRVNLKDPFFDAILYDLLFKLTDDNKIHKDRAEELFVKKSFDKFKEKKFYS